MGTAVFAAGHLRSAEAEASLPALAWRPEGQQADLAAVEVIFGAGTAGGWRLEARTAAAAWQRGELAAGLTELNIVVEPGTAQLRFSGGRAVLPGLELQLQGRAQAHWAGAIAAATADADLEIESAGGEGWRLGVPCKLTARWNGADLSLTTPLVALALPQSLQFQAVEATVGGLRTEHPLLVARTNVAASPLELFAVSGLSMQPAQVAAQLACTVGLARGQEGARLEWSVPSQRRVVAWPGGQGEAAIGGEGVLNLDRNYFSGRAALELRELSAAGAGWNSAAQTAAFTVRWPRLWLESLRGWRGLDMQRLVRELAWAGDYDLKLAGASGRLGPELSVAGVELRGTSRGAELYETGGADIGLNVADIAFGKLRLRDGKVQATLGLEGGDVQGGVSLPGLVLQPAFAQTLCWTDGVVAEGTFGFAPAVLTGAEPWGQWWPALAGGSFTGGIGLQGRSRYAAGGWTAGVTLVLQDFAAAWSAQTISVEKINGTVALPDLATWRTAPAQRLTVGRADLAGVELTEAALEFALDGPHRVQVSKLETGAMGGRLAAGAFVFDPWRPELTVDLRMAGVRLEQLLRLFDDVPAEAEGVIDGVLPLAWTGGRLQLGTGHFMLAAGEFGRVRFTRDLHLLTSGRSPQSMAYSSLRQVEQSIQELHFDRLRIDTYPKDAPGQSLRLRLVGSPAGGRLATPVNLDVNVNAPLEHFLNWGRKRGADTPAR